MSDSWWFLAFVIAVALICAAGAAAADWLDRLEAEEKGDKFYYQKGKFFD